MWLTNGQAIDLPAGAEHAVVLVRGADAMVKGSSTQLLLAGRQTPFDALPSAVYVPAGSGSSIVGGGSLVAVASAPPSGRSGVSQSTVQIGRRDIRVEIRGAGNATRQINHIIAPDFPADRLEVVEVLTPSGNWSSWPPHKHDVDDWPAEAVLEEVYFYQFRRPGAWGMQRLYRADRSRDAAWEVHGGDVVLVTDGYHPFVAAHGDDAYYLNALAGDRRTMACSFDPDWDWVARRVGASGAGSASAAGPLTVEGGRFGTDRNHAQPFESAVCGASSNGPRCQLQPCLADFSHHPL